MIVRWCLIAALLAGGLIGCGCAAGQRVSPAEQEPWYRAPPTDGDLYWTWPALEAARLHEVVEAQQQDAQALLHASPLLKLTEDRAVALIGRPLPDAPGTQPYLVRGLCGNPGTGRFEAFQRGDQLVVLHGSLGSGRGALQRRALVLQLEQTPSEVYVYATSAK
jgi:hypothetical protein